MKILTVTFDTPSQQCSFFTRCIMMTETLSGSNYILIKYHYRHSHHIRRSSTFNSVKETIIIHSATSAVEEL